MSRAPESRGTCQFCGEIIFKRSVSRHLAKCAKRQEQILKPGSSAPAEEKIWHLRVQSADVKEYWLDLEMTGTAKLEQLDRYLRAIWLECCGHLSQFTIGGWGGAVIGKARRADDVFGHGYVLRHLYDFGTTSETDIWDVGSRVSRPLTRHPIYLLARNIAPDYRCQECGLPAAWICFDCVYDEDKSGMLCEEHAEEHPEEKSHHNYGGPMRVVNSPRMGMCGYEGPADPPY